MNESARRYSTLEVMACGGMPRNRPERWLVTAAPFRAGKRWAVRCAPVSEWRSVELGEVTLPSHGWTVTGTTYGRALSRARKRLRSEGRFAFVLPPRCNRIRRTYCPRLGGSRPWATGYGGGVDADAWTRLESHILATLKNAQGVMPLMGVA